MAAREKAGFLAIHGDEIGLGENLQKILGLQCFDHRSEVNVGTKQKQVQNIVDCLTGLNGGTLTGRLSNGLGAEAAELTSADGSDSIGRARGEKNSTRVV